MRDRKFNEALCFCVWLGNHFSWSYIYICGRMMAIFVFLVHAHGIDSFTSYSFFLF
jgi:hypothetical protein